MISIIGNSTALCFSRTHDTWTEAAEFHLVSILVLRRSRQSQKPSDLLLHHNQTLPLRHRRKTEQLSELHSDGDEPAGHGNAPVCEGQI